MSKSRQWLDEHFNDDYVKRAQREGYASRAAYKLLEIQEKDKIFRSGMKMVDLGAAPGGWTQVAVDLVGKKGKVVALDILPMEVPEGATFIQGDFTEDAVLAQLMEAVHSMPIDLVICDMAPNISGIASADQAKSMYLSELALDCATRVLKSGGDFLIKVFHGEGIEQYIKELRLKFKVVKTRKPKSSRARSREFYLLARGFKALSV